MKKVILSVVLIAGLGSVFTSCNNGAYDANPKTTTGTVLNPLNPGSGVTIPIGYISTQLNGFQADFSSGFWTDAQAGVALISAVRIDNETQVQGITIMITGYNGAGTYTVGPDGSGGSITHVLYNPLDQTGYIALGYTTALGSGSGTIVVEGTEDGNLRGTFTATMFKDLPVTDVSNKEEVTNGKFYVSKQQL